MKFSNLLVYTVLSGAALILATQQPAQAQRFKDKTIEVFVPAGAGGGLTRTARIFIKFMPNHIAGKPSMIIKNMPGGGGNKALNFLTSKAKKDGTHLSWGSVNLAGVVGGIPGIRYKPEDLKIIGTSGDAFTTIVRADLKPGINSPKDIVKAGLVVSGGVGIGRALDVFTQMSFELLGLENRHIPSYRNQPKMKAAIMAGEIKALTTGNPGYWAFYANDILKKGSAISLYYHSQFNVASGKARKLGDRYGKGVNHFVDFYQEVTGKAPTGSKWETYKWYSTFMTWPLWLIAPPGASDEVVAELRRAHIATAKDPAFLAAWKKQMHDAPNFLTGADAEAVVANFRNISPPALAYLKKIMGVRSK
ncbi:MAG: hypothetical protein HOO19_17650 [Rhodospirillaceae bacterium]|nr:hypothetical protein [Rhodospirillaceae bacterium]MBT3883958.1 hypothetical protein [Rhodospirillaceae bacterium]MBT4117696.1 hypothetical protein [Rhodospirillaceae bacterium]MBT4674453.1 hypothetical protein [Rhodospirillaceae bacterium]MBT4751165.1 hypothetical protein [Rhodospirillaceae bacterium]